MPLKQHLKAMLALALFFCAVPAHAQVIFQEDFGSGTPLGPPLPAGTTTYTYNGTTTGVYPDFLLDGQYTIASNTKQAFNQWADIFDHTTGNGTGFMLVVNATAGVEDEFYRRQITLTPNTTFELVAQLTPTNSQADKDYCDANAGGLILPNVKMRVETPTGSLLDVIDTGVIPFSTTPQWRTYKLRFTTPVAGGDVVLVLSNNAPGGCGNDIALDGINVRVPVTMVAANDTGVVTDATSGAANVVSVLDNDSDDGLPIFNPVLTAIGLPPQLTFDTATGKVGVVAGAATGTYSFTYEVCETPLKFNCDTATVTIHVSNPAPPGTGICPAGMSPIAEAGYGFDAIFSDNNPAPKAEGAYAPAGTNDQSATFGEVLWWSYIQIDLTGDPNILVAGNTALTLSLTQHWFDTAGVRISVSADGTSWTSLGTIGTLPNWSPGSIAGRWSPNILRHDTVTVPGTGIRYVRIGRLNGGVRVDGVGFVEKCTIADPPTPEIAVTKASVSYVAGGHRLPQTDVVYSITVTNSGDGATDADSVFMVDLLPANMEFYNGDFDAAGPALNPVVWIDNGSGLDFVYGRDVAYASGAAAPASYAACTYTPAAGYDPDVRFVCVNPKGQMQGGGATNEWQVQFRARIP
ncbi:hypothetical protein [Alteraurantiacibacter aquimixticola]|uniref:DUF11 domain-containing protein n=1 Tax=Alteraurantiacibacter aquimixticola TaxID=2489173 RepID=A0A4T3F1K2_9SPHN|nr:hypothetical protein [Alteraurantiacibacter aquimixticola]TIX50155.1 hypothetical protein E5222_07625 [Alteraurantiacibacter aquimixticola]